MVKFLVPKILCFVTGKHLLSQATYPYGRTCRILSHPMSSILHQPFLVYSYFVEGTRLRLPNYLPFRFQLYFQDMFTMKS